MAKIKKSIYFCQNCGHEESKWLGQCPMCKEWNTFVEEKVSTPAAGVSRGSSVAKKKSQIVTLSSVSTTDEERTKTGIKELDRVLGGGIVQGSLVLVGGDPGIGKSVTAMGKIGSLSNGSRKGKGPATGPTKWYSHFSKGALWFFESGSFHAG